MAKRKRGPISKKIRDLCYSLSSGRISEDQFKAGVIDIIQQYGYLGHACYQGIALAIAKWCSDLSQEEKRDLWSLLYDVDPRIRKTFEHWVNSMMR